ncbi:substrate-binding domain-containing protein [Proteiniphilum sp.]|uniref:PstS family phosphate ABC transporter substrate-binding protein n=1 Tax=Proteiniphilum sp. TaxID=1926877 RepID=UPI002B1FB051|nr:substrate-binding domain-containing protein [Proteiniphilum sp.]MEA4918517.1 substrate-binding domain-containing protein [Proteiniphilum sp.]
MERTINYKDRTFLFFTIIGLFFLSSCHERITRSDTPTSGIAQLAVDASFAPIIEAEINVFESINNEATMIPVYTTEKNAYDLLMKDSIRLLIGTRLLTEQELALIGERKQRVRSQKIAIDGVALIIHKENNDTLLTTNNIRDIVLGKITSWKQINPNSPLDSLIVMFDSPSSSMVRYIQDSLCNSLPLGKNVRALSPDTSTVVDITRVNSHNKVVEYVASHPNAVGFVGLNWISNPVDTTNLSFVDNINVISVSAAPEATPGNSYKPLPYQLALELAHRESPREFPAGGYPLIRDIYIIITDSPGGLPSGFFNFIAGDRGQRIILKSGILPANRPVRLVHVTEN